MKTLILSVFCLVSGLSAQEKQKPDVPNLYEVEYPNLARDAGLEGVVHIRIFNPKLKSWGLVKGHPLFVQIVEKHMNSWWYSKLSDPTDVYYNFKLIPNNNRDKNGECIVRSDFKDETDVDVRFAPESRNKKGLSVVAYQTFYIAVMKLGPCHDHVQ